MINNQKSFNLAIQNETIPKQEELSWSQKYHEKWAFSLLLDVSQLWISSFFLYRINVARLIPVRCAASLSLMSLKNENHTAAMVPASGALVSFLYTFLSLSRSLFPVLVAYESSTDYFLTGSCKSQWLDL